MEYTACTLAFPTHARIPVNGERKMMTNETELEQLKKLIVERFDAVDQRFDKVDEKFKDIRLLARIIMNYLTKRERGKGFLKD